MAQPVRELLAVAGVGDDGTGRPRRPRRVSRPGASASRPACCAAATRACRSRCQSAGLGADDEGASACRRGSPRPRAPKSILRRSPRATVGRGAGGAGPRFLPDADDRLEGQRLGTQVEHPALSSRATSRSVRPTASRGSTSAAPAPKIAQACRSSSISPSSLIRTQAPRLGRPSGQPLAASRVQRRWPRPSRPGPRSQPGDPADAHRAAGQRGGDLAVHHPLEVGDSRGGLLRVAPVGGQDATRPRRGAAPRSSR